MATRGRQLWLIPVLVVVVALTAVGGVFARDLYRQPVDPGGGPVAVPTPIQVPPTAEPGSRTVAGLPEAVAHPLYPATRALLQEFFDAISSHNFAKWVASVTKARASDTTDSAWHTEYRSSQDGSIVVYRIESATPGTARVLLTFVSTQDIADAPPELPEHCIRWRVVFPLTVEGGGWKIDSGPTGASPQHDRC